MTIQPKQLRMVLFLLTLNVLHVHPSDAAGFIKWEAVNKGLDLGAGSGITEIATNGAGVVYTIVDGTGLYKSTDGGDAWTHLTGDTPPLQAPYTVAVAPGAGGAVFVGTVTPGSGLWRSDDAGKTWTKAGDAAAGMASSDVEAVAFAPDTPGLMLVGHRGGRLLSVSTNGGKTWKTSDLGVEVKQQLPIVVTDSHWIVASRAGGALRFTDNAGGQWQDG
ncbi:MAG: glycoside hydrolase, partial [Armatimonadota bacterium]|nr:glycoside hydrolase [Armatimonadota bacterium]